MLLLLSCHESRHDQRGNDDGKNPGDPPRDRRSGRSEEWGQRGPGSAGTVITTGCREFLRGGVCVTVLVRPFGLHWKRVRGILEILTNRPPPHRIILLLRRNLWSSVRLMLCYAGAWVMIQCAHTDLAALRSMPVRPRIGNSVEVLAGGQVGSQVMGLLVPKGMFEFGVVSARRAVHFGQLVL